MAHIRRCILVPTFRVGTRGNAVMNRYSLVPTLPRGNPVGHVVVQSRCQEIPREGGRRSHAGAWERGKKFRVRVEDVPTQERGNEGKNSA